ncbi:type II toxin-antitoxin system RelE/ParE family toxin [Deinococcus sp. YIM 134068]|uniref:type II toxin-antitoxin system RelE family toxin n=1 Tax=Deinococcus lichenicola TaxID=3118910 RepID=UPI002F9399BA
MSQYTLVLDPAAKADMNKIDSTTLAQINRRIVQVVQNPDLGKPLTAPLAGLRSVYAASKRYRVVYAVDRADHTVTILAIGARQAGHRRDPYAKARRRT